MCVYFMCNRQNVFRCLFFYVDNVDDDKRKVTKGRWSAKKKRSCDDEVSLGFSLLIIQLGRLRNENLELIRPSLRSSYNVDSFL